MLEKHLLTEQIGMLLVCMVSPMIDREGDKEMHLSIIQASLLFGLRLLIFGSQMKYE